MSAKFACAFRGCIAVVSTPGQRCVIHRYYLGPRPKNKPCITCGQPITAKQQWWDTDQGGAHAPACPKVTP